MDAGREDAAEAAAQITRAGRRPQRVVRVLTSVLAAAQGEKVPLVFSFTNKETEASRRSSHLASDLNLFSGKVRKETWAA